MQPKVQRYNKNIKLKPIKEKENLESIIVQKQKLILRNLKLNLIQQEKNLKLI